MNLKTEHVSVLLKETIEILEPKSGEFFIDGTTGSGGHSEAILKKIGLNGKLLCIDLDENSIRKLNEIKKLRNWKNVILVNGNYADLPEILEKEKLSKADGLIVDLGFSSEQLEGKGMSFMKDEVLDMRYAQDVSCQMSDAGCRLTAAEIINSLSEQDLADIFWEYGEERFSRQIAKKIVEERRRKRILTTLELVEIIKKAVPKSYERGRIHPATRVFQALRIYVNDELGNLEKLLKNLPKIIKTKGRVAIISFHSLEDRLVKNYFKQMAKDGLVEILTKKPIIAGEEEIKNNSRSRSAKMRSAIII